MRYILPLVLFFGSNVSAQVLDTGKLINVIAKDVGNYRNIAYSYSTDVRFPNGDKDHIDGNMYLNRVEKVYYNECNAFTTIYSSHWFYMADHRNKTITIINLDRESSKVRKTREKEIFEGQALATFFESFTRNKGVIRMYKNDGSRCEVELNFTQKSAVQRIAIVYNPRDTQMISSEATMLQPWQRTPKGIQSVEIKMKYSDFRKEIEKKLYDMDNYFSCEKQSVKVKKYLNYKLSTKL